MANEFFSTLEIDLLTGQGGGHRNDNCSIYNKIIKTI